MLLNLKQKTAAFKKISQIISKVSKVFKILTLIDIMIVLVFIFATPFFLEKVDINENQIVFIDEHIGYNESQDDYYEYYTKTPVSLEKGTLEAQLINRLKNYSHIELIAAAEFVLVLVFVYLIGFYWLSETIQFLFKNIALEKTPFTLINVMHVRYITKSLFIMFICHSCLKLFIGLFVFQRLMMSIDVMQIVYILCLVCLSYIFEYGYEIQLDS